MVCPAPSKKLKNCCRMSLRLVMRLVSLCFRAPHIERALGSAKRSFRFGQEKPGKDALLTREITPYTAK